MYISQNMFRTCSEIRTFYLTQNWKDMNILSCIDMHILSYIFSISFRAFFEHVLNSAATHPLPCSLSLSLSLSLFLHSKARCSKTYMIVIWACSLYLQLYLYSPPPPKRKYFILASLLVFFFMFFLYVSEFFGMCPNFFVWTNIRQIVLFGPFLLLLLSPFLSLSLARARARTRARVHFLYRTCSASRAITTSFSWSHPTAPHVLAPMSPCQARAHVILVSSSEASRAITYVLRHSLLRGCLHT